jgi:hypothetical protein
VLNVLAKAELAPAMADAAATDPAARLARRVNVDM